MALTAPGLIDILLENDEALTRPLLTQVLTARGAHHTPFKTDFATHDDAIQYQCCSHNTAAAMEPGNMQLSIQELRTAARLALLKH